MTAPLPAQAVPSTDLQAEEVEAFLRMHPGFLSERPDIYRVLVPPRRLHGENLADHMAAMLVAERGRARAMESEVHAALEAGRAVLALMRTQDVMEAVTQEIPALLGVETCTLAAEPGFGPGALPAAMIRLPRGAVTRLVGHGRDAVVRTMPTDVDLLHAEAAPLVVRDALARVPLPVGPPALIAVGARDPAALPMRQTVAILAFLGRAVSAALSRQ